LWNRAQVEQVSSPPLPYPKQSFSADVPIRPVHLLVLLTASAGAVIWGAILITGHAATGLQQYLLVLGLLGVASAAFVFTRVQADPLSLFGLPVFLTLLIFIRFGLVPLNSFFNPDALSAQFRGHYDFLVQALALVGLGMLAFWLGSFCLDRRNPRRHAPAPLSAPAGDPASAARDSILGMALGLYAVVFSTRIYLLHAHLLDYAGSWKAYYANLASLQVLGVISQLGLCALIVFAIETYQHPADLKRKILFLAVLLSECAWGFIGGNKRPLIQSILMVVLVSSFVQRRIRKGWLLAPFLLLVLFYPLSIGYRKMIRHNGGITNATVATRLGQEAFRETAQKQGGISGWVESGWSDTINRLDLLESVGLVLSLGADAKALQGRERWWMVPYFPFIPRFLWSTKPVLDEGARFSVLLGYGDRTSTAITYPGDLYATYGWAGLLAGMFLLGVVAQALTGGVSGALDKRRLFLYASVFLTVTNMEIDAFSFWTSVIRNLAIFAAVGFVVYGPRRKAEKLRVVRKKRVPQPCEF
jgi:hypothetical protein